MEINWLGLASAMATFFGVWIGHVSVRKIEREVERIWIPAALSLLFGITLEIVSLWTTSRAWSVFCGIVGVTLLWDALELAYRQPARIKHGHAPANPNNPRHAKILMSYPDATTINWLDRDPRGCSYTADEVNAIKAGIK